MHKILIVLGLMLGGTTALWAQVETPGTYGDAMSWYERSAKAGSAKAQFYLGLMHETGSNRDVDQARAAHWFRKAADQGHALAQFRLATYHHFGLGMPVDFKQAASWYHKAANQGVAEAAFNLGYILKNGLGVESDPAGAAKWYRRAAEAGLSAAQFNLGALLAGGRAGDNPKKIVKKDVVQGWVWLDAAAQAGEDGAAASRDALAASMSADQLKRAIGMAAKRPRPKPKTKSN